MIRTARTVDYGYLSTPTGQLNIVEIICLIGALISVGFTSSLYCELVDNQQSIFPEFSTLLVRSVFQSFTIFCLIVTIGIFVVHIYGVRFMGKKFSYINQICLILNILMGFMMISIGICAGFWEHKLRSTPAIIRRGYYSNRYQYIFGELTHPRPGAAAAAAAFAILAGILFLMEACSRPMLRADRRTIPTHYVEPVPRVKNYVEPVPRVKNYAEPVERVKNYIKGERIIPIETTRSLHQPTQV